MSQSELVSSTTQYEVVGPDGGHIDYYDDDQRDEAWERANEAGPGSTVVEIVTDVTEAWQTVHKVTRDE